MFSTWKWTDEDYRNGLRFQLSGVKAMLYLNPLRLPGKDGKNAAYEVHTTADLAMEFGNPTKQFVRGLRTSAALAQAAAEFIYRQYLSIHEQFESVLRGSSGLRHVYAGEPMSIEDFFRADDVPAWACRVSFDDGSTWQVFKSKVSGTARGRSWLRKRESLTPDRWQRLLAAIDNHDFPSP